MFFVLAYSIVVSFPLIPLSPKPGATTIPEQFFKIKLTLFFSHLQNEST